MPTAPLPARPAARPAARATPAAHRRTTYAPPARWYHGLFGCCEDPRLACTVCLCQCTATGQVYERATGSGCLCVSVVMWTLFVVAQVFNNTSTALRNEHERRWWSDGTYLAWAHVLAAFAGLAGLASMVVGTYFLCTARRLVRERDAIPEGTCGSCEDCCVSYWCGCCSMVQLLRQDRVAGGGYRACTATAV